jgi:PhzF family phenazine biosynthesis protein
MTDPTHALTREWRMLSFPVSPAAAVGGNPAGVVFEPTEANALEMVRTAIRLNPVSETAFVWAGQDEYRIRYFAPGGEVALCGHATAAAYGALALAGRLGPLPAEVRSTAPGGRIAGRVERERDGLVVWMDMPVARRLDATLDVDELADALGLPVEVLASRPGAAVEDVGIPVALLPVADLAALDAMRPDFGRLVQIGRRHGIVVFYAFVLDADALRVRARSFAPAVEIEEDPATGTAAAALGAFLAREGLIPTRAELRIRQGEAMGRASELRLMVRHDDRTPTGVRVGGWVRGEPAGP